MKIKVYNEGDIVYWCKRRGHHFSVAWGRVDQQIGDVVYIDYLTTIEEREIDGIPLEEYKVSDKYKKLPKGWNYNTELFDITFRDMLTPIDEELKEKGIDFSRQNIMVRHPESLQKAYEYGYLVKQSEVFQGEIDTEITKQGYRIVLKYSPNKRYETYTTIYSYQLYDNYEGAEREVDENIEELYRQSELTDEEWSKEQIQDVINRWAYLYDISDVEKKAHEDWIFGLHRIKDVEVRLSGGGLEWKYWKNKRWATIQL